MPISENTHDRRKRHGHYVSRKPTPVLVSWRNMVQRCTNPNHTAYRYYGGRGIRVCDRWLSFPNFLDDMGTRPAGYSIERIDVNGNYEPSNCKWIPRLDQWKNRRKTNLAGMRVRQLELRLRRNRCRARLSAIRRLEIGQGTTGKQRLRRRPKAPSAQLEFDL